MMPTEIEVLISLGVLCTPSPEVPDQINVFIAFCSILYINYILLYLLNMQSSLDRRPEDL